MQPFKIVKHQVVIDAANLSIPAFQDLYDRDKSPKKVNALKEMLYVWHIASFSSPYNNGDPSTKHDRILVDYNMPNFVLDDKIEAAIEAFKKLNQTPVMDMLDSLKIMYSKMALRLDTMDIEEKDRNGKPIYAIADILKAAKELALAKKELDALESEILNELRQEENVVRGAVRKSTTFDDY